MQYFLLGRVRSKSKDGKLALTPVTCIFFFKSERREILFSSMFLLTLKSCSVRRTSQSLQASLDFGACIFFLILKVCHPPSFDKTLLFDFVRRVQVIGQFIDHCNFANLIVSPLLHDHVLQALKLQDVAVLLREKQF